MLYSGYFCAWGSTSVDGSVDCGIVSVATEVAGAVAVASPLAKSGTLASVGRTIVNIMCAVCAICYSLPLRVINTCTILSFAN
jgi:hypothetical protein